MVLGHHPGPIWKNIVDILWIEGLTDDYPIESCGDKTFSTNEELMKAS
jgi:hypothetical protein